MDKDKTAANTKPKESQAEKRHREIAEAEKYMYGRPPKYKTPGEMQEKIDAYFKDCDGKPMLDKDGEVTLNKYGEPILYGAKPPTVTGLALALGFSSRMALFNYQAKKSFIDTIMRAKTYIEEYAERRLFDRDGVMGAKFSLANNFTGWCEKQQTELGGIQDGEPIKTENAVTIYLPDNGREDSENE